MFRGMTIRKKIVVLLTTAVLIITIAAWGLIYRSERGKLIEINNEMLSRYITVFSDVVEKDGINGVSDTFQLWGKAYPEGRITIINAAGEVIFDSKANWRELDNHYKRPEVLGAFASGSFSELRYSITQGEWVNYKAQKVVLPGDGGAAVVRLSYPVTDLKGLGWTMGKKFISSLEILLILIWGGAYWMLKLIMRPLGSISRAAEIIASGGEARFPITDDPQIQSLSNALNSMSDSLKLSVKEAQERKEEIAVLVGALPIGLILIDDERKIRYMNLAASGICGFGERIPARGASVEIILPCEEMCRRLDLQDGVSMVTMKRGSGMKIEMTTLTLSRGRLIIMQDFTEKIKLEEARRDFFIDAGHEFQTPLTVIRTGLELLKNGRVLKDADDLKSVDSMIGQQERISRLVDDLLFLVRLDIDPLQVGQEEISLSSMCKDLEAEVNNLPQISAVDFQTSVPQEDALFKGRYDDIKRALFNLLENSVKYVSSFRSEGGIVRFEAADCGSEWEITVDDNGPGIPEGSESIIFERFRRGDHARARNGKVPGGYGLGLSISRRIAERHGGSLTLVESKLGGAAFKFTLPKA